MGAYTHQYENERDPLVHIGSCLVLVRFESCTEIVLRLRLCLRIGLGTKEPAMSQPKLKQNHSTEPPLTQV